MITTISWYYLLLLVIIHFETPIFFFLIVKGIFRRTSVLVNVALLPYAENAWESEIS